MRAAKFWRFPVHAAWRRPPWPPSELHPRGKAEVAVPMYDAYCQGLREAGIHVETGIFQTDMKVSLVNDGPVTLLIDSRRTF